jgi:GH35 family endo-1,4-beta-xylanase
MVSCGGTQAALSELGVPAYHPEPGAASPTAEPKAASTPVPAHLLAFRSTGTPSPRGWVLAENGYVGTFLRVEKAGVVTVTVQASGHEDKLRPELEIAVADNVVRNPVDADPKSYVLSLALPAGDYFVRVAFTNGAPNTSRELVVHGLEVEGASLANDVNVDALALRAANTYIEHFRRGRAKVRLSGARPGSVAKVALVRPAFGFGTNVPGATNRMIPKAVPPGSEAEKFQSIVLGRFDTVVLSNGGKWAYHEATRDKVDLVYVDRFLDFAEEHGLRARMHTMIWDTVQEPEWVASTDAKRPGLLTRARAGDARAKDELRAEISERIVDYVGKRAKRYAELDVVNESAHKRRYLETFGEKGLAGIIGEAKQAATVARAAAPAGGETRLCLNEYNLLQWSTDPATGAPDAYANWYLRHADALRREGAPIDVLGVQYYADGRSAGEIGSNAHSAARILAVLQNLSIGGRRLLLSEFEVRGGTASRARATEMLDETMRLVFGTPQADSFLVWAIWGAAASTPEPASILFEANGAITEVGRRYDALRAAWTTRAELPVAADGSIEFSGFYGDYTLAVGEKTYALSLVKGKTEYAP